MFFFYENHFFCFCFLFFALVESAVAVFENLKSYLIIYLLLSSVGNHILAIKYACIIIYKDIEN